MQDLYFRVLIKWSSEVNSKAVYDFNRETGLINNPHSGAEGGGNVPIYVGCQPPLKSKKEKVYGAVF